MDTRIMIRDGGPYGSGLSLSAAIARLCDGEQVTVTPVDASTPDGDPRGEPRPGFGITVYPARTAYTQQEPPKANWAGIGSRPAADAALFAETLTLASQLATYASLGQAILGNAAAIGEGGRPGRRPAGTGARARPRPARPSSRASMTAITWSTTCSPPPPCPASTASATTRWTWPPTSASTRTATP
jgi:hypothetical protein